MKITFWRIKHWECLLTAFIDSPLLEIIYSSLIIFFPQDWNWSSNWEGKKKKGSSGQEIFGLFQRKLCSRSWQCIKHWDSVDEVRWWYSKISAFPHYFMLLGFFILLFLEVFWFARFQTHFLIHVLVNFVLKIVISIIFPLPKEELSAI